MGRLVDIGRGNNIIVDKHVDDTKLYYFIGAQVAMVKTIHFIIDLLVSSGASNLYGAITCGIKLLRVYSQA